jgi:uncharacterized membrane protein
MLKLLRSVLELIFLAVAINMGYPHAIIVWNYHGGGWWTSFKNEWRIAGIPMLAAIIIVALVIIVEVVLAKLELREKRREEKRRDRRWDALFIKLGIDPSEYEDININKKKR